ncbi:MAG: ABC transporter permease [Patescibacteria group bacterium]|nr:ABC transporter permease [Patescibacteria group bacterium]
MFKNSCLIAIRAIFLNKTRAFLTMLGVIIGVGSVVLLTSIGTGLQLYVKEQFVALGTNILFVVPGNPFGESGGFGNQEQAFLESTQAKLKIRYLDKILRDNRDVLKDGVATGVGIATAKYKNVTKKVTLYGVTANYETVRSTKADKGTWFTQTDNAKSRRVLMLGAGIAQELFGQVDPVGKKIKLDGKSYLVSGVIEKRGGGFGGPSFDNYIYPPLNTLFSDFDTELVDSFIIETKDESLIATAKKRIETTMLQELDKDEFSVFDQTQLLDTIQSILGVLTAGLGGIAAISLVVGGIGIMNIMLVSVSERTREIGLRKALGATPNLIMLQFLIEATLLSIFGGMIGLLIAYLGSLAIQVYFPARVTLEAIILAFTVSSIVGLIFGVAPARRAARLSPIEALRYE